MAKMAVTFTITEFCLHTGVSEEDLREIVGLGVIEPRQPQTEVWLFDDSAVMIVHRAMRLRRELELDWPGIAVALTLLDENARLTRENRLLQQQLARFLAHSSACSTAGSSAKARLRGPARSIQDATFFDDIEPVGRARR